MNRGYQPKIIFGLKLSRNKVIDTTDMFVNDCECNHKTDPDPLHPDAKYCSRCGCLVHKLVKKSIPKFKGFDEIWDGDPLTIEGWPVVFDTGAHNFYIGFYVQEGVYGHSGGLKCDFPDMSKMEQFKSDMKKIGLWNEEMFGAWIVLYLPY